MNLLAAAFLLGAAVVCGAGAALLLAWFFGLLK